MWLSYLLTPWLAPLAESCGTRLKAAAAVLALLLFSAAFWGDNELIIIAARLPVFFAGMLFAAESGRREALTKAEAALLLGLMPVGRRSSGRARSFSQTASGATASPGIRCCSSCRACAS